MANLYFVRLPITTVAKMCVVAKSKKEAINKAMDTYFRLEVEPLDEEAKACGIELDEMAVHRVIAEGNVFHGVENVATAEIEEEDVEVEG